jgi:hypothetical protein
LGKKIEKNVCGCIHKICGWPDEAKEGEWPSPKCDQALKRIFKEMKKDQAEIEKLRNRTRATFSPHTCLIHIQKNCSTIHQPAD